MQNSKAILIFLVGLILAGCTQEPPGQQEELVKTVSVETETLRPQMFSRYIQLVGTVESLNDVRISAEVSGRIEKYYADKGEMVAKGAPILKIDDEKLLSEKDRLEAQVEQARQQYQRLKQVFEEDSVGSEIDIINARSAYRQSKSALESIKVDLNNTTVKAPFKGVLEEKFLEEGEMAAPGTALIRLIGSRQLVVTAGVPARYADVVQRGDLVKLWFDTQASDTLTTDITYVANSINPQNRTFEIEVDLPDDHSRYKVDMITNLRLTTLEEKNVIVVSEEFIYKQDDKFVAYVLAHNDDGDPVAERRTVKLGPSFRSDVIIRDGLKEGDEFITSGSAFLNDGMRLNIIENREETLARQ